MTLFTKPLKRQAVILAGFRACCTRPGQQHEVLHPVWRKDADTDVTPTEPELPTHSPPEGRKSLAHLANSSLPNPTQFYQSHLKHSGANGSHRAGDTAPELQMSQ